MKLNFYSKIIILLITMIPHCFASTAVELAKSNTHPTESTSVTAGRLFIESEDDARCAQYEKTPGEFEQYKQHTTKIDALLSDENKVKKDETASDAMIAAIVKAAIDKEITHYNDGSITGLSPVKKTLQSLTPGHALINHFTVLSLIEDAAASFVTGAKHIFNSAYSEDIANNANSIYSQIEAINSSITRKVFTDCLTISYGKHETGIKTVIAKIQIEEEAIKSAEAEVIKAALEAKEAEKLQEIEDARIAAEKLQEIEDARIAAEK
ncbi:MAG: hypothetical protein NWS47_02865, partial [Alphaproteobacteria bacterium]|nr:hypothetical protein [Alphaproteobacteria bacterium]